MEEGAGRIKDWLLLVNMCCRLSRLNLLNEPQTLRQTVQEPQPQPRAEGWPGRQRRQRRRWRRRVWGRTHVPTLILLSYWRPKPNGARQELDDEAKTLLTFEWPGKVCPLPFYPFFGLFPLVLVCRSVGLSPRQSARVLHKGTLKTLSPKVATLYFRTHVAGHFCDYHLPLPANSKL